MPVRAEQVSRYIDIGREHGFDAVLTISNQITASPDESPVSVEARKGGKKVPLRHLSWWQVMTEARVHHIHRGVSDPDQAWILGELIAYLDNERAGAGGFEDMGEKWVTVRDAARAGTLRASDAGVRDVAARWEQFLMYLCMGLTQDLGREVTPIWPRNTIWPRNMSTAQRLDPRIRLLADTGQLEASIKIPGAVGPLDVTVDLRTRQVTTAVQIDAPREG